MSVVKIELDRERALNEAVRVANFLKRTPPNTAEALRELTEAKGLIALLKDAPLIGSSPTPPPPPDEPPPSGEAPILDMSKISDWHGTNANPGDITEVSGGIQLRVPNDHEAGSMSGNPRAELLTAEQFRNGEELWLHTDFTLKGPIPSGWMTLVSFASGKVSIAPWHISCVGGKIGWQLPPGQMDWTEPAVVGAKVELLHHHKFGSPGHVETWLKVQGKDTAWRLVCNKSAELWAGINSTAAYLKDCCYYQKGTAGGTPVVVVFGRTRVGKSRASVGA